MSMFGGGKFTAGTSKQVTLNDASGSDTFQVKDSDGFTIFKVDSLGNVYTRRAVQRI